MGELNGSTTETHHSCMFFSLVALISAIPPGIDTLLYLIYHLGQGEEHFRGLQLAFFTVLALNSIGQGTHRGVLPATEYCLFQYTPRNSNHIGPVNSQ